MTALVASPAGSCHSVGVTTAYEEMIHVPRVAVKFPLELPVPEGFVVDEPETWPRVEGRLEFVGGRLYFMPPCADRQQETSNDVATALGLWRRAHPEFTVGGNAAGMVLGGESRGADAAVWRRADLGPHRGKYQRVAPILAAEIQGEFEDEAELREKASWYFSHGVEVVWLLFPNETRMIVLTPRGEERLGIDDRVPAHASLPGLEPAVVDLFAQVVLRR